MNRDCKTCIYSNFQNENDNGCTKWECEYKNKNEVLEALKQCENDPLNDTKKIQKRAV